MNEIDQELEKIWERYSDKYKQLHKSIFYNGYHTGRHVCKKNLVQSGWLIIDPNKKEELNQALEDPCKYCEHYVNEYRQGCSLDPSKCQQKEKQMLAIEIKTYFDLV